MSYIGYPYTVKQVSDVNLEGYYVKIPESTTTDRDTNIPLPQPGMFRYNTTEQYFEGYDGISWEPIGETSIVEDTSPKLGGNLDLNGNIITEDSTDSGGGTVSFQLPVSKVAGTYTFATIDDVAAAATDLINDDSPQLGGDLDLNGNLITEDSTDSGGGTVSFQLPVSKVAGTYIFATIDDVAAAATDLINDDAPQLGGNLDLNGNSIISVSNSDVNFVPNGTGVVNFKNDTTQTSEIRLYSEDASPYYTGLKSAAHSSLSNNITLTLPVTSGTLALTSEIPTDTNQLNNSSNYITLTNISIGPDATASGSGNLSYANGTGVFTFTPPDLSGYALASTVPVNLDDLSDVSTSGALEGQVLIKNAQGTFSFSNTTTSSGIINGGTIENLTVFSTAAGADITLDGAFPTGTYNTIFGSSAGNSLTVSSSSNTAIGHMSNFEGSGDKNTSVGWNSLYGSSAATGDHNTALGDGAILNYTTGSCNVGVGTNVLTNNTTGSNNVAIGTCSMHSNSIGYSNTALGSCSLLGQGTTDAGCYNTAVGSSSMLAGACGCFNTAVGFLSLSSNVVNGVCNTGVGFNSLKRVSSGSNNVGVGTGALSCVTTGSSNFAIGTCSGADLLCTISTESNHVILGNNSTTCVLAKVALTVPSDERDKTDISGIPYGLNFIKGICPVTFKFDDRSCYANGILPDGTHKENKCRVGFLAQNIISEEKLNNPSGQLLVANDEREDRFSITESNLIPVLVKALQELTMRIEQLEKG